MCQIQSKLCDEFQFQKVEAFVFGKTFFGIEGLGWVGAIEPLVPTEGGAIERGSRVAI